MAGGSGTRFWPKSSSKIPKQLLSLTHKRSQIQLTFDRLESVVSKPNRWVIATKSLKSAIKKQLSGVKILAEPEGRNTMAAACWSAWTVAQKEPDGLVAVLPADAHIGDVGNYQATLEEAFLIAQRELRIVCLGIKPTFPATCYGYIQSGNSLQMGNGKTIAHFIEKPSKERAHEFFQSGSYSWNAGIFIFRADVFQEEVRIHAPDFAAFFDKNIKTEKKIISGYKKLPSTSVDVGLMEKTNKGAVVTGDFGWNDLGSWPALGEVLKPNSPAGIVNAPAGHISLNSKNVIVDVTEKKFVGLIGVENLIVVETSGALLICHQDHAQEIKNLVSEIRKNKKIAKKLL